MSVTVCYFIQSHRDPEQINRLIRALRRGSPRGIIVVQHDYAGCSLDPAPIVAMPNTHVLPVHGLRRASFDCQMQSYINVVDWLERKDIAYDWLVNISGQDYPVAPIARIEASLAAATCDGFLRYWDVGSSESPWSRGQARRRYLYRYWRLPDGTERKLHAFRLLTKLRLIHFHLTYGPHVGIRRLRVPFDRHWRCYGGWAWYSLRRAAVQYLARFLQEHPRVMKHYRGTLAAEESLVQTVLVNSGRFNLVNDDLRYIHHAKAAPGLPRLPPDVVRFLRRERPPLEKELRRAFVPEEPPLQMLLAESGHVDLMEHYQRYLDHVQAWRGRPRVLTVADLPALGSGRYHFARKFDLAIDHEVLDCIDRELLGIDPRAAA
jgi:hypothetical protein